MERFGAYSAQGGREDQEDAALVMHNRPGKAALLAVFDGMGGHSRGEVASGAALMHFRANAHKVISPQGESSFARELRLISEGAHAKVVGAVDNDSSGTTLAAAAISGNLVSVAHCGDSRVYLLRNGVARPLTRDHVRDGYADNGELRTGLLTSALSARYSPPRIDVSANHELQPGDAVVVVTDGVSKAIRDDSIARAVRGARNAQDAAERLVGWAGEAGGTDNATAVVYLHFGRRPRRTVQ